MWPYSDASGGFDLGAIQRLQDQPDGPGAHCQSGALPPEGMAKPKAGKPS